MSISHPDGDYGSIAKIFHWVTVPLMGLALATGLVIPHLKDDAKNLFYTLHESAGLTILLLSVARLGWRRVNPPPPLPESLPRPLRVAATATHHALYVVLILQPLLGFFTTNAYGFPQQGDTAFWGFIDLPKFMEAREGLAGVLHSIHQVLGWLTPFLLAAHVCGAIYHHAIRKDGTLMRML